MLQNIRNSKEVLFLSNLVKMLFPVPSFLLSIQLSCLTKTFCNIVFFYFKLSFTTFPYTSQGTQLINIVFKMFSTRHFICKNPFTGELIRTDLTFITPKDFWRIFFPMHYALRQSCSKEKKNERVRKLFHICLILTVVCISLIWLMFVCQWISKGSCEGEELNSE